MDRNYWYPKLVPFTKLDHSHAGTCVPPLIFKLKDGCKNVLQQTVGLGSDVLLQRGQKLKSLSIATYTCRHDTIMLP